MGRRSGKPKRAVCPAEELPDQLGNSEDVGVETPFGQQVLERIIEDATLIADEYSKFLEHLDGLDNFAVRRFLASWTRRFQGWVADYHKALETMVDQSAVKELVKKQLARVHACRHDAAALLVKEYPQRGAS